MPRAKIWGYGAVLFSLFLFFLFFRIFLINENFSGMINQINPLTFYTLSFPIGLVSLFVIGTGFCIGWTILTIKVVPPMPEIVEKKDYTKIKASFLCLITFSLAILLLYGIYIKNFWALAIPAAVISLVILGAIFWVGIAIITTRSTLPEKK